MYTFVFMWTPALKTPEESKAETTGEPLEVSTAQYLGLIFAVFMVCVMVGSSIFKLIAGQRKNLYKIPLLMHSIAFLSMAITTYMYESKFVVYMMFLVFETTVGIFYPAYGVIKSEKIPGELESLCSTYSCCTSHCIFVKWFRLSFFPLSRLLFPCF